MEDKKTTRMLFTTVAAIFAAATGIILAAFLIISRNSGTGQAQIPHGDTRQVLITANPGGAAPTMIPTATPEPAQGMDSPLLCKMELAGLHKKASERGAAGILTLNSYDYGRNTCIFDIKNNAAIGDLGKIETFHNTDTGAHGITIMIDKTREDVLQKWGEAALLFFNAAITAESAGESVRQVLAGGTADSDLLSLSVRDSVTLGGDKVRPVRVLEIKSTTAAAEN